MIHAAIRAALFFFVGVLLGGAHFALLRRNVGAYLERGARGAAVGFHVARLALLALVWVVVARLAGAVGLLAAFAGFLLVRPIVTARFGVER